MLEKEGHTPIVLDSKYLLKDPEFILKKLCLMLNIPFTTKMLKWKRGSRKEDGIWAKYWYKNVINSTGFNIYKEKDDDVPSKYLGLYNECIKIYNELAKYKIT